MTRHPCGLRFDWAQSRAGGSGYRRGVLLPAVHGGDEVMVRFAGEVGRAWANSFRSLLAAMAERRRYVVDLADAVGSPAILEDFRAGLVEAAARAGSTVRFARLAPTMLLLPILLVAGRSSW